MTHHLPAISLFLGLCAGGVMAEPSPMCGKPDAADWHEIHEVFVGEWRIEHQSGYALMGQMVLPFPGDGEVETLSVVLRGDVLEAIHPQAQAPLVLRHADEPRWLVDRNDLYSPAPVLSPDDVGLLMGCDQMDLPRIIGTSTAVVDGVRMDFTYRMMAADWSTLFGVMEVEAVVQGTPVIVRRTVWMHEVAP